MQQYQFYNEDITIYSYNTIIVGTGAAGYNAAERLYQFGQHDFAMVTESIYTGTSRNTGSDKQTYYKLSLCGDEPDSVMKMAGVLYGGKCVDGEHALAEAALSVQCFMHLAELGVPFPQNKYGEYVGYKTDHDPSRRATSAGPYTSKMMTEALQKSVESKGIKVHTHRQALRILTADNMVKGLLCLNKENYHYEVFLCKNIVFATGGPAGMYLDSAYPRGHFGATGIAFEAGAAGKNLTEWQFGIASVKPRWNVSGTYMQVLPKFVSTDKDGNDEREFLMDYFHNREKMLSMIFLKGYQWPFDVRKVMEGSSIIDLLVYQECCLKGRRVFLDFRDNPGNTEILFDQLSGEAYEYLSSAKACFGTPIERLEHMNAPAVSFFLDKGVDLKTERLEVALCAQHNNGGLSVNEWWQTNIAGLFAVGEVSGTQGVYRPGGSALNAGQAGAFRAAQYIAARCQGEPDAADDVLKLCKEQVLEIISLGTQALSEQEDNLSETWETITARMSRVGAAIRNLSDIHDTRIMLENEISSFPETIKIREKRKLCKMYRLRELMICQYVYLGAMEDYINNGGLSRGSAMYTDIEGDIPDDSLPEMFRFRLEQDESENMVQEVKYVGGKCEFSWRKAHEIPDVDHFFENVWRDFRINRNIY